MDRRTEISACDRDTDGDENTAPTAADAAVQQISVEPDSSLSFAAGRDRAPLTVAASGTADLSATVRYLAAMKNVPVTPQQVSAAAKWAGKTLLDERLPGLRAEDLRLANPATRIINRIVDVIAATNVMHHVTALIEGNVSVDPETLVKRGEAVVDRFTGGAEFFRWPESKETFDRHYADVPWAPFVINHDDGAVTTSYLRNNVLHRDPSQGPAFHRKGLYGECSEYWVDGKRHRPHEAGPAIINTDFEIANVVHQEFHENGQLHRPAAKGPAILQTLDAVPVLQTYIEHDKLHRDPSEGPALHLKTKVEELWQFAVDDQLHRDPSMGPAWRRKTPDGESWQYIVNGKLHRDHRDGPAFYMVNPEGAGNVITEYHENGAPHRPSAEGPAVLETDASGRTVLEVYLEHGKLHRDPKQGPAKHRAKPEDTWIEYALEGQSHRDPADGPAIIFNRFDGQEVKGEEYRVHGELHRPSAKGAAVLIETPDGTPIFELYAEHGKLHRDPSLGPAWREIKNGVEDVQYRMRGDFHRDAREGPASFERDVLTGVILREVYFRDGNFDRDPTCGPAIVERDSKGDVTFEEYWKDGELLEHASLIAAPNRRSRRAMKTRKARGRQRERTTV